MYDHIIDRFLLGKASNVIAVNVHIPTDSALCLSKIFV